MKTCRPGSLAKYLISEIVFLDIRINSAKNVK